MPLREPVINPPEDLAIGLAKIILHWSLQMWLLQQVTYCLLTVDMKQGRLAVRDPRADEYIDMVEDLMELEGVKTTVNMKDLRENLRELKTLRDAVAHGVWMKSEETGKILIQVVSGTWKPDAKAPKTSRRMIPEGKPVDAASLESIRDGIEWTMRCTQTLLHEVQKQIATSPKKQPPAQP